jgi:hypothetical protein
MVRMSGETDAALEDLAEEREEDLPDFWDWPDEAEDRAGAALPDGALVAWAAAPLPGDFVPEAAPACFAASVPEDFAAADFAAGLPAVWPVTAGEAWAGCAGFVFCAVFAMTVLLIRFAAH